MPSNSSIIHPASFPSYTVLHASFSSILLACPVHLFLYYPSSLLFPLRSVLFFCLFLLYCICFFPFLPSFTSSSLCPLLHLCCISFLQYPSSLIFPHIFPSFLLLCRPYTLLYSFLSSPPPRPSLHSSTFGRCNFSSPITFHSLFLITLPLLFLSIVPTSFRAFCYPALLHVILLSLL